MSFNGMGLLYALFVFSFLKSPLVSIIRRLAAVTLDRIVYLFDENGELKDKFFTKSADPKVRSFFSHPEVTIAFCELQAKDMHVLDKFQVSKIRVLFV